MGICYSEDRVAGGTATPVGTWDGTKHYLKHYANSLYLAFIAKSTKDGAERRQAESELAIAERKMAYWRRHPNYVQADALKGIADLKKQWNLA